MLFSLSLSLPLKLSSFVCLLSLSSLSLSLFSLPFCRSSVLFYYLSLSDPIRLGGLGTFLRERETDRERQR